MGLRCTRNVVVQRAVCAVSESINWRTIIEPQVVLPQFVTEPNQPLPANVRSNQTRPAGMRRRQAWTKSSIVVRIHLPQFKRRKPRRSAYAAL